MLYVTKSLNQLVSYEHNPSSNTLIIRNLKMKPLTFPSGRYKFTTAKTGAPLQTGTTLCKINSVNSYPHLTSSYR